MPPPLHRPTPKGPIHVQRRWPLDMLTRPFVPKVAHDKVEEEAEEEDDEGDDYDTLMALEDEGNEAGGEVLAAEDSEQAKAGAAHILATMTDDFVLSPWPFRPSGAADMMARWEEAEQAANQGDDLRDDVEE